MIFFHVPPSGNRISTGRLFKSHSTGFRGNFARLNGFSEKETFYTGSGTGALHLVLLALKRLHPGKREVVLPAWCCPSVPQAILQAGLLPVQVDLDPSTFSYPPAELASVVTGNTLTILLVHFFGIPQPRPELQNPPPLFVRDCAQDFHFRNLEETDCAVFYSFGRGKTLNVGHGGALCLPKESSLRSPCGDILETFPRPVVSPLPKAVLMNALSNPRIYGFVSSLPFLSVGETIWRSSLRFTRIHPSFFNWAQTWLEGFERYREDYARLVREYIRLLSGISGVILPFTRYGKDNVPVRFPILVKDGILRERFFKTLNQKFGGVTGQYPEILSRLPGTPAEFPRNGSYSGCEQIVREILTFPMTAWLSGRESDFLKEVDRVSRR